MAIDPDQLTLLSTATCDVTEAATDSDGDKLTMTFGWKLNGDLQETTEQTIKVSTLQTADKTPAKDGDKVVCTAIANDGVVDGPIAESTAVEIGPTDACAQINMVCGEHATCVNNGTLQPDCKCNDGFEGDGKDCTDLEECAKHLVDCGENATCQNQVGTYSCVCKPGFTQDNTKCIDVDECQAGDQCDVNAECKNTAGSFECHCNAGYEGDGKTCNVKAVGELHVETVHHAAMLSCVPFTTHVTDLDGKKTAPTNELAVTIDSGDAKVFSDIDCTQAVWETA